MLEAVLASLLLAAPAEPPRPVPPSVPAEALCEELGRGARTRKEEEARLDAARSAAEKERERLEALRAEIEKERQELRHETARLQTLIDEASPKRKPTRPQGRTSRRGSP